MPTKAEIQARPELLMGPNPLIERAAPFIPFDELPGKLIHRPLENVDWRLLSPPQREPLLDFSRQHFVPTDWILEPVAGIQRLFRRGLMLRNPMLLQERIRTARVMSATDVSAIRALPRLDGAGGIWASVTGMGKTTISHRALEIICPDQVIVHDACRQAGWERLVQCCYLLVDHPSNGSRGGLLKRILLQLDEVLFTDYFTQYERLNNIDTLLALVCRLLCAHRVALVVIDENQGRNFVESPWQMEFVLFYLSLMNLGISVLLLGNPLAFEHLHSFSQVQRRFSVGGVFNFQPAAANDAWWGDQFAPGMRSFSVVEKCSIELSLRIERENDAAAGFPGLFEAYHTEAQRAALRRGGKQATLEMRDYDEALNSPRYVALHELAVSFRANSGEFADVPLKSNGEVSPGGVRPMSRPTADVVSSMLSRYKAEQTRLTNSFARKMRALEGLSPDDLRMLGASDDMLAQLIEGSPFGKAKRKSATSEKSKR